MPEDLVFTVGVDFSSVPQKMNAMAAQIQANSAAVEKALTDPYTALGIVSTQALNARVAGAKAADDAITKSATASLSDISRSHQALQNIIKQTEVVAQGARGGLLGVIDQVKGLSVAFQQGQGGASLFNIAMTAMSSYTLAAATALGLLVTYAVKTTSALADTAVGIRELASVSGLSASNVSMLQDTLSLMGLDAGRLSTVFFRLGISIDSGGEAINRLGIAIHDDLGNLKEPGDAFLELRDRINQIDDSAKRDAVTMQIFGRGVRALGPFFAASREEIQRYQDTANQLRPYTQQNYEDSIKLMTAQNELKLAVLGLNEALGFKLLPTMTDIYNALTGLVRGFTSTKTAVVEWIEAQLDPLDKLTQGWLYAAAAWAKYYALAGISAGKLGTMPVPTSEGLPGGMGTSDVSRSGGSPPHGPAPELPYNARELQAAMQRADQYVQKWKDAFAIVNAANEAAAARGEMTDAALTAEKIATANSELQHTLAGIQMKIDAYAHGNAKINESDTELKAKVDALRAEQASAEAKNQVTIINLNKQLRSQVLAIYKATTDDVIAFYQEQADASTNALKREMAGRADLVDTAAAEERAIEIKVAQDILNARLELWAQTKVGQKEEAEAWKAVAAARKALDDATTKDVVANLKVQSDAVKAEVDLAAGYRKIGVDKELAAIKLNTAAQEAVIKDLAETASDAAAQTAAVRIAEAYRVSAVEITQANQTYAQVLLLSEQNLASQQQVDAARLARDQANASSEITRAKSVQQAKLEEYAAYDKQVKAFLQSETEAAATQTTSELQALDRLLKAERVSYQTYIDARQRILDAGLLNRLAAYEKETKQIQDLNALAVNAYQAQIDRIEAVAQATGDIGTAMTATLARALTKGTDFWSNFTRLAQDGAQSAQQALSVYFFDAMSGKLDSLQSLFTNFWAGLKKNISDFLANTVLNQLGSVLGNLIGVTQSGTNQLNAAANTTAATFVDTLVPAADFAAQALSNLAAAASGESNMSVAPPGPGGIPGALPIGGLSSNLSSLLGVAKGANTVLSAGTSPLLSGLGIYASNLLGIGEPTLGPAATGIQALDMANAGASFGEIGSAASAAAPAISVFGTALAGVGAALTVFSGIMDLVNGKTAAGVGTLAGSVVGGIGGAIVGYVVANVPGAILGALMGVGIGGSAGGMLGGLFGGPSNYALKRTAAQLSANQGVRDLTGIYQAAALSQNPDAIQAALSATAAGGSVRTNLQLPSAVASSLGISGQQIGDFVRTEWASLTKQQFAAVLNIFKANPALEQAGVLGSGDVPYLGGAAAQTAANNAKAAGIALIDAFNAIGTYTKQVNTLADSMNQAATVALPKDFADAIKTGLVEPLKEGMLALVGSGLSVADMTKALQDFQAQAKNISDVITFATGMIQQFSQVSETAFAALPQALADSVTTGLLNPLKAQMLSILSAGGDPATTKQQLQDLQAQEAALGTIIGDYDTINSEIASARGNLEQLTQRAAAGFRASLGNFNDSVAAAFKAMNDTAAAGGETAAQEAAFVDAVHTAVVARYQYELSQIQAVEQSLAALYSGPGSALLALQESLASFAVTAQGNVAPFDALVGNLLTLAQTSNSATVSAWALAQGLQAITLRAAALVQTLVTGAGAGAGGGSMGGVIQGMVDAAAPFIAQFGVDVQQALDAGDTQGALALLQQETAAIQQLGAAQVQLVQQWAQQATQAVQAWAQAQVAGIQKAAKAQVDALDEQIAAIDAQVKAIQDAAQAQEAANSAQIDNLNAQIKVISDAAQAQEALNQAQLDNLSAQASALQDTIQNVQQWQQALDAVTKYITQLQLSPSNPANPMTQMLLAQSNNRQALAAFQANPTAAGVQTVQDAADAYLKAAQQVYARPSLQYQAIYAQVLKELQGVQGTATTQRGPVTLDDLQAQLKAINDQIKTLNAANQQIAKDAAAAIKPLQDQVAALQDLNASIQKAAEAQVAELQKGEQALKDQIDAINKNVQAQVDAIGAQAQAQIDAINAQAKQLVDQITQTMNATLGPLAAQEQALFTQISQSYTDLENVLTGGKTTQDAIKTNTDTMTADLNAINANIAAFLGAASSTGGVVQAPVPTTAPPSPTVAGVGTSPTAPALGSNGLPNLPFLDPYTGLPTSQQWFQSIDPYTGVPTVLTPAALNPAYIPAAEHGAFETTEGPHYLHDREMVLPAGVADWVRGAALGTSAPAPASGGSDYHIELHAHGVTDPDAFLKVVERRLRSGDYQRMIRSALGR